MAAVRLMLPSDIYKIVTNMLGLLTISIISSMITSTNTSNNFLEEDRYENLEERRSSRT